MIKKILHTKLGAMVGFKLGIKGFNRLVAVGDDGKVSRSYNYRVNKGADLVGSLLTGTSLNSISSPLPPKYLALSTSSLSPAYTDTTLTGETAATGLTRGLTTVGAYTSPTLLDGAASYTLSYTFTNSSGGSVSIVSAAIFDAVSSGNLFAESNLSATYNLGIGNTLALTWTINI